MNLRAILLGLAFAFMWSSAFSSARIIVADAPPLATLAVRFLISGVLGMALARALGETLSFSARQWRAIVIFGLCQNALYLGLNFVAMQTIEASLASIIASSFPLWVGVAGWFLSGTRLTPLGYAGLLAGMIGVVLIMGARLSSGVDAFGLMLCVVGVIALTVATLSVTNASKDGGVLMAVGAQMIVGAAALAVSSAVIGEDLTVTPSTPLVLAFIYTTLVPGLLATFVWFKLVAMIGPVKAATFHFLNPFLGVAIAAVILGERLGFLDIVGVIIITLGILAVQLSKGR